MKRSEQIANEIAAKREAAMAILSKGADITSEDIAQAKSLKDEISALEPSFKDALDLEQFERENKDALDRLNTEVVRQVPFAGGERAGTEAKASVLGFAPAGETVVDTKTLAVTYEEGDLGLDQKTLAAISSVDYKRAFRSYVRKGINGLTSAEYKTLQEGSDTAGGFTVPEDMLGFVSQRKPTPTRIASQVTNLQTSRDALTFTKVNYTTDNIYTTGMRVTWTGEVPSSSTAHRVTDPVFGQARIPVHTAMMSLPVTLDMIEDSAFPVISWASEKFAETIDILKDNVVVNGTGNLQPAGILMAPGTDDQPDVVNSGNGTALTADGLMDLAFALPEQYDENARFYFNKTSTAKAIAKLKDADNRYLYGFGLQDSGLSPSIKGRELLGYGVTWSGLLPDVAANAHPIIFGDLRGYFLVTRVGFSIQVIREKYAEDNQIVLLGRLRLGGQTAEPFRMRVQKVSA